MERNTKENLHCTPAMHTSNRSLLKQINWLQSKTQFQSFSDVLQWQLLQHLDVKALNNLTRQLMSQQVKLHFWPLTKPLRIFGFPHACHRNNEDGSSQTGMAVFLAESRERSSRDGMRYGSRIDYVRNFERLCSKLPRRSCTLSRSALDRA